jgi:penicillin-insensitive murein endopeptidase
MECSNKEGGRIFPHRTHQNGLSVDFMIPLIKNGIPYYGLDNLGANHYLLDFNNNGEYLKDTSIKIDFNMVA